MINKIENQKVSIPVNIEGIDKFKDLSDKLKQQVKEMDETIFELQSLGLELKINQ